MPIHQWLLRGKAIFVWKEDVPFEFLLKINGVSHATNSAHHQVVVLFLQCSIFVLEKESNRCSKQLETSWTLTDIWSVNVCLCSPCHQQSWHTAASCMPRSLCAECCEQQSASPDLPGWDHTPLCWLVSDTRKIRVRVYGQITTRGHFLYFAALHKTN